jgi:ATP-dependent RNA helicase DeaD
MSTEKSFSDLSLPAPLLKSLAELGYETPTPIQMEAIPVLMEKRDLFGQAQTGTGKTAAFALPLLTHIDPRRNTPQVLVLTPTRELAIQVAESFQGYGKHMKGINVLPIYGGQGYIGQLKGLKRGVQVVVGTPGRLLDHLNRGTLKLDELRALVLDEGDEMLHMGFIEDVEKIISSAPANCLKAMFSATLPEPVKRIARNYLREPAEIRIASKTTTVESVEQRYLLLKEEQKPEALTRILEVEDYDGVLIFVRTRANTVEVAAKLEAAGFPVAALNGDMNQTLRETTINRLKSGRLKIVVATDVAARGLDVDRLSLVINYDIPQDPEPYVHRIGRTGRAGRNGKAILFVTPREKRFLKAIEHTTRHKIEAGRIPTSRDLERKRGDLFKERIRKTLETKTLDFFNGYLEKLQQELGISSEELAPALLFLAQKDQPLQVWKNALDVKPVEKSRPKEKRERESITRGAEAPRPARQQKDKQRRPSQDFKFDCYRVEVGKQHNINTSDIVGAIANEVDLDSRHIGRIKLFDDHSTVELPEGMPKAIFHHLKKVYIRQRKLNPSLMRA